jgi:hypothetical protein
VDSSDSGEGPLAEHVYIGYEPSGFIKGGEFLDQLSYYLFLLINCASGELGPEVITVAYILGRTIAFNGQPCYFPRIFRNL